jgi:hypothetical protein
MLHESNSFNLYRRISVVPFGLWPKLAAKLTGDSNLPQPLRVAHRILGELTKLPSFSLLRFVS